MSKWIRAARQPSRSKTSQTQRDSTAKHKSPQRWPDPPRRSRPLELLHHLQGHHRGPINERFTQIGHFLPPSEGLGGPYAKLVRCNERTRDLR